MKTWNQLLVRHGWLLEELERNVFSTLYEAEENIIFLLECFEAAGLDFSYTKGRLSIHAAPLSEEKWIELLGDEFRGRTEAIWISLAGRGPAIAKLDIYISGLVRQLNRLGFSTVSSCDGHGRRHPYIFFSPDIDPEGLVKLFEEVLEKGIRIRKVRDGYKVYFQLIREHLFDVAEQLSYLEVSMLGETASDLQQVIFSQLLEQMLMVPGMSGQEEAIRCVVEEALTPYVDHVIRDSYGNLLAEKTYRTGSGPTILLNAHLDVVEELIADRTILKENGIWRSSVGILGADDRAGVAVLLHMAQQLFYSNFNGRVKFIFTVEEEIGLCGARQVEPYFLWGTDAAIVLDRRGTGDIVSSYYDSVPFCDPSFAAYLENLAGEIGETSWQCTSGASSDTRIWAEHGIQSVNLSVGYMNEHTDGECLDLSACFKVTVLLKGIFSKGRELKGLIKRINRQQADRLGVSLGK